MALLEVKDLHVEFPTRRGVLKALQGINFTVKRGERLGIVGESGAGKSLAAFAIINLLSKPGRIAGGEILFEGKDLTSLSHKDMRSIRGNRIAMIFQDPMMTLNPVLTIGTQMIETLKAHRKMSDEEAKLIAIDRLTEVRIPSAEARLKSYPHELSGGMRQRVVIAIALLAEPALIIADEPTTALDVTIQAEIMSLMLDLCKTRNVGLILITHDLAVVSQVTQKILVMYAGHVVEQGKTADVIPAPHHPYTSGLISALPQQNHQGKRLYQIPGSMPTLNALPAGCPFAPRCGFADDPCSEKLPDLLTVKHRRVRCFKAETLSAQGSLS